MKITLGKNLFPTIPSIHIRRKFFFLCASVLSSLQTSMRFSLAGTCITTATTATITTTTNTNTTTNNNNNNNNLNKKSHLNDVSENLNTVKFHAVLKSQNILS